MGFKLVFLSRNKGEIIFINLHYFNIRKWLKIYFIKGIAINNI